MLNIDPAKLDEGARLALASAAARRRELILAQARMNPDVFASYVLRDERTGSKIKQGDIHREWHRLISAQDRIVIWSAVDIGKTNQISIGRALFELGRNPNLRIAIGSKTKNLAMKIVRAIGQYISTPGPLHDVFPHLRPTKDPALPWTSLALTIERPKGSIVKDPSIQAFGNFGNVIGSRIDLLILDDVIDQTNTRTAVPRQVLYDWVRSTLFGRLTSDARVVVVGNALHPDDLLHRLAKEPRFVAYRFPVLNAKGEATYPERWPLKRIEAAKADFGPLDYTRLLLCMPRDDDSARFQRQWVDNALEAGIKRKFYACALDFLRDHATAEQFEHFEETDINTSGIEFFCGVDLAVQQHASADLSAFVIIARFPNGRRQLVNILTGRMGAPTILKTVEQIYWAFGCTFVVENVAAQDYIVQLLRDTTAIPVIPYTTGRQKAHSEYGIEGIASELAAMKWVFPCVSLARMHPELFALMQDMLGYDPKGHTGDRLMALWFAREGARLRDQSNQGGSGVGVTIITSEDDEDRAAFEAYFDRPAGQAA